MAQLLWANLIDMYQPPGIDRSELEKIVTRSYLPVLKIFEQSPKSSFTLNLPGSTVELLIKTGFGQVVRKLRDLAEQGQVDFTATPKYQLLIPLQEDDDIDRQIEAHNKICNRYFGIYYKPRGLYSPYLAFGTNSGKIGARFSMKWILIDESVIGSRDSTALFMDKGAGGILLMPVNREITWQLNGSFRARKAPRSASDMVKNITSKFSNNTRYLITVSEARNFGHRIPGRQNLLRALYQDRRIKSVSVSQLQRYIKHKEFIKPIESSSETFNSDAKRKNPFYLWENDKNAIQQSLWKLYKMAVNEIKNAGGKGDPQYVRAREMMDMASAAINWDQISCRPWWNSSFALKAADDLAIAVFVILSSTPKAKEAAIQLRQKIYDQISQYERSGEMKKAQQGYLKSNNIAFDRFYKDRI
ncbi:MAG: hypothetical protein JSU85_12440 [Candidatus Zixiibacteriota bacterium]|nr:MAG: hypothetical protein JSU85_12440 [candidate division Zixibacteria bacterium]